MFYSSYIDLFDDLISYLLCLSELFFIQNHKFYQGEIMKYLKAFSIVIIVATLITLISSSLCYRNIISNKTNDVIKIISMIIPAFISGLYIGKRSTNKGYLEGIKVGGITVLFLLMLSYLGFNNSISVIKILYYLLIFMLTVIGSIVGINKKEDKK